MYSAADRMIEGLLVVPAAVGAALYPVMAADRRNASAVMRSTLRWSIPACAAVTGLSLFPGALIISTLFGHEYSGVSDVFRLLAPTILLAGLTIPLTYLAQARERILIAVFAVSVGLATDITLDLILIPRFSYRGAAASATLAEVAVLITLLIATFAQNEKLHAELVPAAAVVGLN